MTTAVSAKAKQLKLIKTLWGIDDPISPDLFRSIRQEGYHGVEVIRLAYLFDKSGLIESLNAANLSLVCQIHTCGGYLDETTKEYIYCGSDSLQDHKRDFQRQIEECEGLLEQVSAGGFINVHAGVDAWNTDETMEFMIFCLDEIEKSAKDTLITFETHRQRLFGNPFQTREILSNLETAGKLDRLKLNADLSHWYCACERVFDSNKQPDVKWWPKLLEQVAERCYYIHARFGWAQGPQMADPSAKECEVERILQLETWKSLINQQLHRESVEDGQLLDIYMSPEYGPSPYLASLPHIQDPVASLPSAVAYTKSEIEKLFSQVSINKI